MAKRLKILADTSGIIALLDASDKHHQSVIEVVENYDIIIPSTIIPEVDYLATKYLGESAFAIFIEPTFRTSQYILIFVYIFKIGLTIKPCFIECDRTLPSKY